MVAEEMRDTKTGRVPSGQEAPSAEGASLVAELTRLPPGYPALLEELKTRIRAAQLLAALTCCFQNYLFGVMFQSYLA